MDYKKIGLKVGLELHQQLDTNKLFCNCPSILRDDKPDIVVFRKLRASAGETGSVDIAAAAEQAKNMTYKYEAYSDTTCLIELDEEPPMPMNKEALDVVLQISLMLNAKIVDYIQVMRKTIVNGSNVSGFQRTSLVGRNGFIETENGRVGIPTIMIEEDAAKDIEKTKDYVVWRLDRLGIPLIEIGTDPDIHDPLQAKEVASFIGMVMRSTGKVKRGLGTVRQDLNVSITGGDRIEIKGAQDLKMIPVWIDNEILRQQNLILIKNELKGKISKKIIDLTGIFSKTQSKVILNALKKKGVVLGMKLSGFSGFIGREVQPGRRLGTEFSDYAKVAAGVGGIFHSDELPKYGITEKDVSLILEKLSCKKNDGFVIVADSKDKCTLALDSVFDRAMKCYDGVVREVRRPNQDGTTSYMRSIPGAARMYPETDIVTVKPDISGIELPELLVNASSRYVEKFGLSQDLANFISKAGKGNLFEKCVSSYSHIKPAFIAEAIVPKLLELKRKQNIDLEKIHDDDFFDIFSRLDSGKISKDAVEVILMNLGLGKKIDYSKFELLSDEDLEAEIKHIIKECKELPFNAIMGRALSKLKEKAEAKKIIELLKKHQ